MKKKPHVNHHLRPVKESLNSVRPMRQLVQVQRCTAGLMLFLVCADVAAQASIVDAAFISRPSLVTSIMGLAVALLIGLGAATYKEKKRLLALQLERDGKIKQLLSEQEKIRVSGSEAEERVAGVIRSIVQQLDPDAIVDTGIVMRYSNVVAGRMSSYEIDCLLISKFGIVAVEVKNWKGQVAIFHEEWIVTRHDGNKRMKSPIRQNYPKAVEMSNLIQSSAKRIPLTVQSIVVLSHPQSSFPVDAPIEVMSIADLHFYLRNLCNESRSRPQPTPLQLEQARTLLWSRRDRSEHAKHHFLLELADKKIGAQDYFELETMLKKLRAQPTPEARSVWRIVYTYLPLAAFAFWLYWSPLFRSDAASPPEVKNPPTIRNPASEKKERGEKAAFHNRHRS